jgi:hypothetical protein
VTVGRQRRPYVVVFEGFELLDVFGPLEILDNCPIGVTAGKGSSAQPRKWIDVCVVDR